MSLMELTAIDNIHSERDNEIKMWLGYQWTNARMKYKLGLISMFQYITEANNELEDYHP